MKNDPGGQGNRIYIEKVIGIAIAIGIGIENNGHFDSDSEIKIAGKIINAIPLGGGGIKLRINLPGYSKGPIFLLLGLCRAF